MKVAIQNKDGNLKVVDLNRRKAVRERCINCSGWHYSRIRNCKFNICPLHPYRSGNGKQDAKAREKSIRKYCLWCSGGKHSEVTKCPVPDCPLYVFRKKRLDEPLKVELTIE